MTELRDIEQSAEVLRANRDALADAVVAMVNDMSSLRARHMQSIRPLILKVKKQTGDLTDLVEGAPELFEKPKSQTLHGIKVGFQKQRGKTVIADSEKTVALIRKHIKAKFKQLVKVTETPDKTAIGKLSGNELKKIGVRVEDDTDVVIVKPIESETEKLINNLINEFEDYQ